MPGTIGLAAGNSVQVQGRMTIPAVKITNLEHPFKSEIAYRQMMLRKGRNDYNMLLLGRAYAMDMQMDKALFWFNKCSPINPIVAYLKALTYLSIGRYEVGWTLHESRFTAFRTYTLHYNAPAWDGRPTDEELVLWQEGGFGDVINFIRFLPEVLKRAPNAIVGCDTAVFTLLNLTFPDRCTFSKAVADTKLQCSLTSLPALFPDVGNAPYLERPGIPHPAYQGKIGFKAKGNPQHTTDILRSLPDDIIRWFDPAGRGFVSVDPEATRAIHWLDTAAVIDNLELLITVDTGVAHLAGAMGVPVWLLLNKHHDWRWSRPWYDCMKIFKCKEHSSWKQVLTEVDEELKRHGKAKGFIQRSDNGRPESRSGVDSSTASATDRDDNHAASVGSNDTDQLHIE